MHASSLPKSFVCKSISVAPFPDNKFVNNIENSTAAARATEIAQ